MKKKFADSFNGLKTALKHKAVLVQCFLGAMAVIGGLIRWVVQLGGKWCYKEVDA